MKKPFFEVKENLLETVEDMIKALMEVPKEYTLNPMGQKCAMAVDHYRGAVCLDDPNWIDEREYELKEEIATNNKDEDEPDVEKDGDGYLINVPDEKLAVYNPELFVVMGYSDNKGQLMGVFSKEELAKECGDELVEAKVVDHYEIELPKLDEFGFK